MLHASEIDRSVDVCLTDFEANRGWATIFIKGNNFTEKMFIVFKINSYYLPIKVIYIYDVK